MALEKQIEEHLEILPNGNIQIKQVTKILDDGVVIATNIHRSVVEPGEVVADKSKRIKDIAGAIWTPALVAEHKAKKDAAAAKNGKGPSV